MTKMAKRSIAQNVAAKTRRMGLVAVLATAGTIGTAQNFAFSNFDINGNQRVEDGTILTFAGIDAGETLSAGDLNEATQRIRESGLFESVTITPRGNTLVIDVVEFPTINQISIEGNSRLRDAQLLPLVTSEPRRVFNPAQAERDTAAITQAYASQGRINATVTPRLIQRTDNRVDLVFEVVESAVTEIERISFVGNRNFSEGRLRRVLDTKEAGLLRGIISRDTYSPERIERDKQLLTDFYRSRGYPDFVVQNVDVALTRERDAYLVTFNVQEGQQFTFGNVVVVSEVNGINAGDFQPLIRSRAGETYSPVPIETDLSNIERLALQKGIQFMAVEPRITRDDRDLTLDVTYALVPGPRVFIERINVAGNGTTLDRVIRNQFTSVEGDPFNPNELRASGQRIQRLGFFANADVNARAGTDENQVIVDVDVTEAPTGTLSFGANYNGDTGFGLIASYAQTNFGGRGQRLSFDVSTTQSNRRLAFGFSEPQLLGRYLRLIGRSDGRCVQRAGT